MRAVIAGAGVLGRKIAKYLINAGYEIIFIDYNINNIKEVTDNEGMAGIYGQCTSLDIMKRVDVGNADIFIAVTSVDEINILGCEVANYFGTPKKVAKIDNYSYLTEEWLNNMYNSKRLSVNSIISQNIILSESIISNLNFNHSFVDKIYNFFNNKVKIVSLFCSEGLKIIKSSIASFNKEYFRFNIKIIAINRDNNFITIDDNTTIKEYDKLYILIDSSQTVAFLEQIDTKDEIEKYYDYHYVTIIGDHNSIKQLATQMLNNDPKIKINIITTNPDTAANIAKYLHKSSKERLNIILYENFEESIKNLNPRYNERIIIMNNNDKSNILISLYCKFHKISNISCVLQSSEYEPLINYMGISNIYIMDQYILLPIINALKGPYEKNVQLLSNELKLIELHIASESTFIGKKLSEININNNGIKAVAAISGEGLSNKDKDIYIKNNDLLIQEGDKVLFLVQYAYTKKADEIFNKFI